jgi:hypothetical protein
LFEQWVSETKVGYFHVFGLITCFIRINEISVEGVGRSPLVMYILFVQLEKILTIKFAENRNKEN